MNWRKYIGIGLLIGACVLYALALIMGVEYSSICQVCGESIRKVTQLGAQFFVAFLGAGVGGAYLLITSLRRTP